MCPWQEILRFCTESYLECSLLLIVKDVFCQLFLLNFVKPSKRKKSSTAQGMHVFALSLSSANMKVFKIPFSQLFEVVQTLLDEAYDMERARNS